MLGRSILLELAQSRPMPHRRIHAPRPRSSHQSVRRHRRSSYGKVRCRCRPLRGNQLQCDARRDSSIRRQGRYRADPRGHGRTKTQHAQPRSSGSGRCAGTAGVEEEHGDSVRHDRGTQAVQLGERRDNHQYATAARDIRLGLSPWAVRGTAVKVWRSASVAS